MPTVAAPLQAPSSSAAPMASGIDQSEIGSGLRHQFAYQPETLCGNVGIHRGDSRGIATRAIEAGHEAKLDGVGAHGKDDRDG